MASGGNKIAGAIGAVFYFLIALMFDMIVLIGLFPLIDTWFANSIEARIITQGGLFLLMILVTVVGPYSMVTEN